MILFALLQWVMGQVIDLDSPVTANLQESLSGATWDLALR